MKRNACQKCVFAVRDDNPHCGLRGFTSSFNVEWCSAEDDKVPNGYELQEDGYFSWVKKKKEYPKTYEECYCVLLERASVRNMFGYKADLMVALQKLLVCRDAYWKLYGEEMGLEKPWEPIYQDDKQDKHCIYVDVWGITLRQDNIVQHTFSFPTPEMRDAFYENFKELIEQCKELL